VGRRFVVAVFLLGFISSLSGGKAQIPKSKAQTKPKIQMSKPEQQAF
jgi:hypothetical protein